MDTGSSSKIKPGGECNFLSTAVCIWRLPWPAQKRGGISMNEKILTLLEEKKYQELKQVLNEMESADIAAMFEELPESKMTLLFRLLSKETAAEVFVELESDTQEASATAS